MKQAALKDRAIGVIVRLDRVLGVFELDKCKTFAFTIALLERNMDLLALATVPKAVAL